MRILIISLIFFLNFVSTYAQKSHQLQGVIGIQGGDLFNYDLTLYPTDKANEYKGHVKTYALKDKKVEADVIVVVNAKDQSIELTETQITKNTGFESKVTICLVRAILKYDPTKGVLAGPIITQTANNDAYCARGNITFTNTITIKSLLNIVDAPIVNQQEPEKPQPNIARKPNPPTIKPQPTPNTYTPPPADKIVSTPTIKKVTEGKDETIEWHSDKIIIEVWDDNTVDGDIVTVMYNGNIIADQISIKKQAYTIEIPVGDSELNMIAIKAMNDGFEPPNTAVLKLIDGNKEHKIEARNQAGKLAIIRIKKVKL